MWLPNTLITGDTLMKFYAAKGYRVGFNQLFPIKKFLDNNFSLTTGLWFQQEFGHKDILVTSNFNSAGFRKVKENIKGNSLAILLSLDYHYYKMKYSIGFNYDLYYNSQVTALYEDKTKEVILNGPESSHSIYYIAIRFPILAKYNLYGLSSVSFLLHSRMYLSFGLNYDVANFKRIKK